MRLTSVEKVFDALIEHASPHIDLGHERGNVALQTGKGVTHAPVLFLVVAHRVGSADDLVGGVGG
jgi:hypothetical protein